jgi:hypothetical protein
MSIKLHQLTDEGLRLQEIIETNPELDLAKALVDFQGEFNTKALDLGMVYRNIIAEADVYESESKRLADKSKSLNKRAEGLRIYIEQQMELLGLESIKGDTFSVKFRKLPPLVIIENQDILPKEYIRITPELKEPDKKKLLEDLASGIKVEGASLKTDRRKLEIK